MKALVDALQMLRKSQYISIFTGLESDLSASQAIPTSNEVREHSLRRHIV